MTEQMIKERADTIRKKFTGWTDDEIIVELHKRLAKAHLNRNNVREAQHGTANE